MASEKVESKKIADQLKQNITASLKCLFGVARQSMKNNNDIVGMPCIHSKDANIIESEGSVEGTRKEAVE